MEEDTAVLIRCFFIGGDCAWSKPSNDPLRFWLALATCTPPFKYKGLVLLEVVGCIRSGAAGDRSRGVKEATGRTILDGLSRGIAVQVVLLISSCS